LSRIVDLTGRAPKYTVTDQGPQFQDVFRRWCAAHRIKPRFGAIGRHGSIAVVERSILSLKNELRRQTAVGLA
jgi:transposase InsO family protein